MQLSQDDVKHIAKLARLGLKPEEIDKFSHQLSDILTYSKLLDEVDTADVEPIAQITGLKNVSFVDEAHSDKLQDQLLEQSPMPIQDHMIKVKNVF
jgi:aspartyl-tRNA(Asn)/glutamyl-tRNA(Gln) amidotransferase subunit C